MKKNLTITIYLFLSFLSLAQKDSIVTEKRLRYGVSLNQSLTRYGFPSAILFTLQYGKHQFDLGPQFRLGRSFNKDSKNIGLEFNYRCYLAGDEHWFSSYVLFNLGYFHEYSAYYRTIYNPASPELNGKPSRQSEAFDNLALNAGYGVKFKLGKSLYLGSNIGIGYLFSFYTSKRDLINVDWTETSKSRDGYLGGVASVYIGYKFK